MKKYTFIPWLRRQIKREDPIGDLARDTFDPSGNFKGRTRLALEQHMFSYASTCDAAWETLNRAFDEFKIYRNK